MKRRTTIPLILLALCSCVQAQSVFPTPERTERRKGDLRFEGSISVHAEDTSAFHLKLFWEKVLRNAQIEWRKRAAGAAVRWKLDPTIPADAYRIDIGHRGISISASGNGGFIYAVQTLRQWVDHSSGHPSFACVRIEDAPRTEWRSFLLDSGRQFHSVSTVRKYIEMASLLKMNHFHWHLTEGLGWRVDIRAYPLLTAIGSKAGKGAGQQGFYTAGEIRDLVDYARQLNVNIIPEIDMPGHSEAALAAYPELSCFGEKAEIPEEGFTANIFCAGKDSTILFLKNVLDEVCCLFPSPFIHLGGDEAPKSNWERCNDCRRRISKEGLTDCHDLQLWFSSEMANHLKGKGRKAVFWGDVLYRDNYPLPEGCIIQWWNHRGHKDLALRNALKRGYPVVCGTNYYTYLNFPVTPWKGYTRARTFDLRDAYLHNPADSAINEKDPLILGMSCALWSDYGLTEELIDRRLFPRIIALAEQMWHKGERLSFDAFHDKVRKQEPWFRQEGYDFGEYLRP